MIQDFSNTFDGKQSVRVRSVSHRGNHVVRKVVGFVLTASLLLGLCACLIYAYLIRSGLDELSDKEVAKLELMKTQQSLFERKNELLTKKNIETVASVMGLYLPNDRQLRNF